VVVPILRMLPQGSLPRRAKHPSAGTELLCLKIAFMWSRISSCQIKGAGVLPLRTPGTNP
jgi:hypothetical protein